MYEINNSYRVSSLRENFLQNKLLSDNRCGFNLHQRPVVSAFYISASYLGGRYWLFCFLWIQWWITCFCYFTCSKPSYQSNKYILFCNKFPEYLIVIKATVSCFLLSLLIRICCSNEIFLNEQQNFAYFLLTLKCLVYF